MHSTGYIIKFITVMTVVVALLLTGLRESTKDRADINEAVFNKKGVLASIQSHLGEDPMAWGNETVEASFDSKIKQYVFNYKGELQEGKVAIEVEKDRDKNNKKPVEERGYPVWVYEDGGEKFYVISVYGKGLWDKIWGCVALKSDLKTIAGVAFDHKGETPGLGAEIKDSPAFKMQFNGTEIYDESNNFVGIKVRKGGAKNNHQVDAISGATITGDGVSEMMIDGIKYYEPIFETIRKDKL